MKKYKLKRKTRVQIARARRTSYQIGTKIMGIIIGSILMAVAYNILVIPYGLLSGGVGGLSLLGKYLFNIPLNVGLFILNVPIFIWGLKELDRSFMIYSVIGTLSLIIALPLTKPFLPVPDLDIFLASVFSGIFNGAGVGIMLRAGASSGGTDIAAVIMKEKKNISVGVFSFYCNIVVLILSLYFFDLKIAMYTTVSMWVSGKVTDYVIEGLKRNKSVTIISENNLEIAQRIMNELHRGVTLLEGQGAYSGQPRQVINCVVNNFEIPKLKEIVTQTDRNAFVFITEIIEVLGKGFSR